MKKGLIIFLILVVCSAGFLFYDWYDKTQGQQAVSGVPVYSWTDAKGVRHYSDTEPPADAQDIEKTKGYKYVSPPLVVTIKDKAFDVYQRTKTGIAKLFKPKSKKKKKQNK